jgi:hypothetical protein
MNTLLEIGDWVTIRDFSSLTNGDGSELLNDDYDDFIDDNKFFVLETDQNFHFDDFFKDYLQDVVIINPDNTKKYRISSFHIRKIW